MDSCPPPPASRTPWSCSLSMGGLQPARLRCPWGFSKQEYWSGLRPPGDLPNPGIDPRSPALRADSLPAEPPGKPHGLYSYQKNVLSTYCVPGAAVGAGEMVSGQGLCPEQAIRQERQRGVYQA